MSRLDLPSLLERLRERYGGHFHLDFGRQTTFLYLSAPPKGWNIEVSRHLLLEMLHSGDWLPRDCTFRVVEGELKVLGLWFMRMSTESDREQAAA